MILNNIKVGLMSKKNSKINIRCTDAFKVKVDVHVKHNEKDITSYVTRLIKQDLFKQEQLKESA